MWYNQRARSLRSGNVRKGWRLFPEAAKNQGCQTWDMFWPCSAPLAGAAGSGLGKEAGPAASLLLFVCSPGFSAGGNCGGETVNCAA